MTMLRGHQLKLQLAALCKRHGVTPIVREPLPPLPVVTTGQIITGYAATPDVDSDRCAFQRGALSWPSDLAEVPLLVRHQPDRIAGKLIALDVDSSGRLKVVARCDDLEACRMRGFSVTALVHESEIRDADSCSFHALIHRASIVEVSLTPSPANEHALVLARRDVGAIDDSHDVALAAATRARDAIEQLRAAWSSNAESKTYNISLESTSPATSPRPTRAMPVRIYGSLPAAILQPKRNSFRDLIARLPVGGP
ncbi:HK97 family phage prohead protease [Bradyrhizobium japonicum]|uniref:HK97 family phage prohead protease n=1 Tax=Bradyrhizobium japonicum TaxID=375 RepID=UPI0027150138|nr:HK97 family phage prohead protease [Bradyrhizobium japonicum]WLB64665.1 HK97 family phage prohead protease [Bradyrhizobium japonicum]